MTSKSPRYSHLLIPIYCSQSQPREALSLQRDHEWKVLPNFRQNQKEGGWGNIIFSCSIMIHRFGKSIFSEGFLQHLTQRYINPSHCLWLTPQHCNNNANFFYVQVKGIFRSAKDIDLQEFRALLWSQ